MTANAANQSSGYAEFAPLQGSTVAIAQRFLGLSICFDYLSKGQGHRASRRVVAERLTQRLRLQTVAAAGQEHRRAPTTGPDKQIDSERRYLLEVHSRPRLSSREEYLLVIQMRAGSADAHDALIEANLGLVVMFARRYQRPGVPMLDLVAEGNFGLLTAAERFDPELGCRFATYAKWWVMRAIQTAIPKLVGVVRLPVSRYDRRAERLKPQLPEISGSMQHASSHALDISFDADHGETHELSRDSHPILVSSGYMDTDATDWACGHSKTGDQELLDNIAIPEEQEPPQAMMAAQGLQALQQALDDLPERDRVVISKRFALHHDQDHVCTLEELAVEFGVSKERIRQIENAALAKLQSVLRRAGAQGNCYA